MPENFSFQWELFDKVSANAQRIERALNKAEAAMRHAQGSARGGTSSWAMFGLKMGAVSGVASELTRGFLRLGEGVIRLGVSGAKYAIEAASFRENSLLALEAVLGSKQAATEALSQWSALSEKTPFDNRKVIEWGKALRIAGHSAEDTITLLKGVADLGVMGGATPEQQIAVGDAAVEALTYMKELGVGSERTMRAFARMGIPLDKVMQNIADKFHGGNLALAKGLGTKGLLSAFEAEVGVMQAIQDKVGGKLGGLGKKGSETLTGLVSKIDLDDLFVGLEKSKGFNALKDVLRNIREMLDPRSASGKAIHDGMIELSNTLGEFLRPLTGPEGKKNMVEFFTTMKDTIKDVLPGVQALASALGFLAKWGVVEPLKGFGLLKQALNLEGVTGPTGTGGGLPGGLTVDAALRASATSPYTTPSHGIPSMLARPITVTNTIHIHGDVNDADDLAEKITVRQQESFLEAIERLSVSVGG